MPPDMRLDVTDGKGGVKALKLTANGETAAEVVVDPANATQPMGRKAWTEDMGGTAPLEPFSQESDECSPESKPS